MKCFKYFFLVLSFVFTFNETLISQDLPKDFSFIYKFGFKERGDERTVYNSAKELLTVYGIDTVMNIYLKLNETDKQNIYRELQKINFNSYPEKYNHQHPDSEKCCISLPCQYYSLSAISDSQSKSVEWNNGFQSKTKDKKHESLMQLDRYIEKIIWSGNPLKDYHPTKMRY